MAPELYELLHAWVLDQGYPEHRTHIGRDPATWAVYIRFGETLHLRYLDGPRSAMRLQTEVTLYRVCPEDLKPIWESDITNPRFFQDLRDVLAANNSLPEDLYTQHK